MDAELDEAAPGTRPQYFRAVDALADGTVVRGLMDVGRAAYACGPGVVLRYDERGFHRL